MQQIELYTFLHEIYWGTRQINAAAAIGGLLTVLEREQQQLKRHLPDTIQAFFKKQNISFIY